MSISNIYQYDLMDHAKNPRNWGIRPDADFCSKKLNPSCGDVVTVCGFVKDGKVAQIYFEGAGCVLSLAMASKLTEYVSGMNIEDIMKLDDLTVEKLLQVELGINRLQCGMLSIKALQQGVATIKA